jgi:hypothetical protein
MTVTNATAQAPKTPARGQILIIFVFAIIILIGITGLAVDGGNIFADRRHAQNAADTAALAAALMRVNTDRDIQEDPGSHMGWGDCGDLTTPSTCGSYVLLAAMNRATDNGYTGLAGSGNTVEVHIPPVEGPYADCSDPSFDCTDFVQVIISTNVDTWFARVLGVRQLHNRVNAVAVALTQVNGSPFPNAAIVGLDPKGLSFNAHSNAQHWKIKGGGIFANHDADDPHSNVEFLDGNCVTAVHTASGFTCGGSSNNPSMKIEYPSDVLPMLPPIPTCKGTATAGKDKVVHPDSNASLAETGSVWTKGFEGYSFAPGLYCMKGPNKETIQSDVMGTGVTFYMMNGFDVKFNGKSGSFAVQAPDSGTYAGVLMFSDVMTPSSGSCPQNLEFRGNGSTPVKGTIFLPGACVNWLGTSSAAAADTQLVGWQIYTNGGGDAYFNYNADDNYQQHFPGQVGIVR